MILLGANRIDIEVDLLEINGNILQHNLVRLDEIVFQVGFGIWLSACYVLSDLPALIITSEEFDEVGAEIARALDHFNAPEREKQEVLAAIVARKTEVVNG